MLEKTIEENLVFCCPTCSSLLKRTENFFLCEKCDNKYRIEDDIPIFGKESNFFFWDIPKGKMESILEHIDEIGWQESVLQLQEDLPHRSRKIWSRICNPRRWPWIFLLPINSESRVLDFGSGWGNNSISLAQNCKEVYSIDTTFLYLRWLKAYAKNRNIHNIIPVHGGDTPHLPFKDNYFDIVVMSGVLEWIGEFFPGNPQKSQQMVLNEVARVLKGEGCLYIGIENRINYKYFLGGTEGHVGMKFVSLLPRSVTKILLKAFRGKDFQVYTYSMYGYKNMLQKAGFDFTTFLTPIPNYGKIVKFIPLCDSSKKKLFEPLTFDYSNRKQKILMNLGAANFVPSFSIFASRSQSRNSLLKEMINHVLKEAFGHDFYYKGKVTSFKVKEKGSGRLVLKLILDKNEGYFLKIDTDDSESNIISSAEVLSKLRDLPQISNDVKKLLPEIIKFGRYGRYGYILEREAKGKPGEVLVGDVRSRDKLIRDAISILKLLHKNTCVHCKVDEGFFDEYFRKPIYGIEKWMMKDEQKKYKNWFLDVEKFFYNDLKNQDMLLVFRHGDFVPNNCVADPLDGRIIKILDWEYFEEQGLPLLDVVSFLNRVIRPDMRKKYLNVKFPGYPEEFFSPYIMDIAYDYLKSLGLSKKLYKNLVFMWWVKYLGVCYPIYRYQSDWRKEAVFPVIERWNKILSG